MFIDFPDNYILLNIYSVPGLVATRTLVVFHRYEIRTTRDDTRYTRPLGIDRFVFFLYIQQEFPHISLIVDLLNLLLIC